MVVFTTSQASRGWLKLEALANIPPKEIAFETSQLFIVDVDALLKAVASANILAKLVIWVIFQPPKS